MVLRRFLTVSCLLLALSLVPKYAFADDDDSRSWGNIPQDQLRMTHFPGDTNATAVILFDCGNTSFDEHYDMKFTRHTRIKILTKGGFDQGTVSVDYYTGEYGEDFRDLEGYTYSLNDKGEMVKQEMEDKAVFTEKLPNHWERKKFTLPSLSPGCVIEFRYAITSESPGYVPNWNFQTSEPTLWSEYELKTPTVFQYAAVSETNLPFEINDHENTKEPFASPGGMQIITMNHHHWVMKDVPALREEPFMTTTTDYTQRVMFQLATVNWPGETPRQFLRTWEKVSEELTKDGEFGKRIDGNSSIGKVVKTILAGVTDKDAQIETIYNYVRTTMLWDKSTGKYCTRELSDVLSSKTGNSGEINLLLIQMLREAGVATMPVILSTRSHGRIQDVYPIARQFNYVIAALPVEGGYRFLDATDRERPSTLLPYRALNHRGLLINEDKPQWVTIEPTTASNLVELATVHAGADGTLTGTAQWKCTGYAAQTERESLFGKKADEYVKSLVRSGELGLTVDSFTITGRDSVRQPLIIQASISSDRYVQTLDSVMYINPMMFKRVTENPLKLEKREFPVDYGYPRAITYVFNLSLPEGYRIEHYPENFVLNGVPDGASYERQSMVSDGTYAMTVKYHIDNLQYPPEQYAKLRSFYSKIVTAEAEQIVLKKIPAEVKPLETKPVETKAVEPVKAKPKKSKKGK